MSISSGLYLLNTSEWIFHLSSYGHTLASKDLGTLNDLEHN